MLKIDRKDIYHDNYGWLDTYHHFSFANYYDPDNMNFGDKDLRLLQIWITPDKKGYEPKYGDYEYGVEKRKNKFLHLVSGKEGNAHIRINQDADIFVGEFDKDAVYYIPQRKKVYGVVIEGKAEINGEMLETRDAFKVGDEDIQLRVENKVHIMIFQTNQ